jgi:hypothetical protein
LVTTYTFVEFPNPPEGLLTYKFEVISLSKEELASEIVKFPASRIASVTQQFAPLSDIPVLTRAVFVASKRFRIGASTTVPLGLARPAGYTVYRGNADGTIGAVWTDLAGSPFRGAWICVVNDCTADGDFRNNIPAVPPATIFIRSDGGGQAGPIALTIQ